MESLVDLEIRQGKPWWKVCCTSCVLFLLLVAGVLYVIQWLMTGTPPSTVTTLPENFPADVTLYRLDLARGMTYSAGRDKGKFGKSDTVVVRWETLPATRDELYDFYVQQFQRNGFAMDSRRDAATATDILVATRDDIRVQLQVQDLPDIEGIDSITVVVEYVHE